ncbi:cytochrome P450 76M5-like [Oryza brachyantha]|uniref:cytochrome P450 76M5-like n=1 Tax=Oryza brachyantha TaxID=4533 RepID=UPI001ADD2531|nr:cytochrome P450 76M5-like [Oryza brachyantha]
MEHEVWWLLCAALAAAMAYCAAGTARRRRRRRGLPPGPPPLPVIGNVLSLRGNMHHALAQLAGEYGPVMTLKLGLVTTVVVSSADAAREAFTRHDRRLAARAVPDASRARGFAERSMIWLPSSDPRWKTLRGVVATHVFSPRSLAAARGVRERKVRDIVAYIAKHAGEEMDIGQVVYGGVINLVSSAFFSADVVDVGEESAHGLREAVEQIIAAIAKPNVSDLLPFLRPLDLQGWRRWAEKRYDKVFGILNSIVDRRLADGSAGKHAGDFLDSLLELLSAGKIARDDVTTIMFDVFAAGTDTIAITVEWAMAELLRNPSIMAKARAEMKRVLAGGKNAAIEENDVVEKLPYLQAVVKEALRLHPVAPILLPHRAVDDGVEIGGYTVPKGSTVIFNVWAIMRDPAAWERPDEFMPERFFHRAEEAAEFRGKDYVFIPFGTGRRLCPGLPMAERVVPLILASLLHAFRWKLPNGMAAEALDVSEQFTTVNVLAAPLKAVPVIDSDEI